jgi:hypothetical protein
MKLYETVWQENGKTRRLWSGTLVEAQRDCLNTGTGTDPQIVQHSFTGTAADKAKKLFELNMKEPLI